jgi:glutamyl/glutaminyl-tRNA synthetase
MKKHLTMQRCRLATTGQPHGPSLYHLPEVLGKEKSAARIERALQKF